jgi:hypothetical protein
MSIVYGEDTVVENGKVLNPEITFAAPRVSFSSPNPDAEYTFAMVSNISA